MSATSALPGAAAADRLRRIREIVDTPPQNRSAAIVLAQAAIEAYQWDVAREALAPYLATNPTQAICVMMAEIEEGESSDLGKAREWTNRAVRAPRDPVWTADGITADEWEPISPVTGKLDAFEWKVPTSAVATRVADTPVTRLPPAKPEAAPAPEETPALPPSLPPLT